MLGQIAQLLTQGLRRSQYIDIGKLYAAAVRLLKAGDCAHQG